MSDSFQVPVTCPKCGVEGEAEIWKRIDCVDSPDEAQWLIDGFLFEYECPDCGTISTLNHDCLYVDAPHEAMILYVAKAEKTDELLARIEACKPDGYSIRLVENQDQLREKAALLRDGLDDRAVEVAKQAVFNRFVASGQVEKEARVLYGAKDDDGVIVEFVSTSSTTETTIPCNVYNGIAESLSDVQPVVVDRVWALNILNNWQ